MKPTRRELLATAAQLPLLVLAARPAVLMAAGGDTDPITEHQAATLRRVAWLMFPIEGVADARYEEAAVALAAHPDAMAEGVAALDELAGGSFVDLPEAKQVALLKEMEGGGFFATALEAARMSVLNNPETWALIGYDGSSLAFGGYLDHGLNDIDWLPTFPTAEGSSHE